jgi:hypothetical protein
VGPPIGSHVDAAGGLATRGLAHAAAIGAEVIQVFASNPRGWAASPGDPANLGPVSAWTPATCSRPATT